MATLPRKPAPRPAKPAHRHFARKAPKDARDLDESSEEEQEQAVVEEQSDVEIGTFTNELDSQTFAGAGKTQEKGAKALKVALGNVQVQDGKVIIDGKAESGKTLVEQQKGRETSESESESEEEEEESSEEEESESEEEAPRKPQLRPVFVAKRARDALKEREGPAFDSEEAIKKREAAAEERRRQSRAMAGESIKRGLEEKEVQEPGKEIDDTDGIDPEEEFQAWRMRELMRLKREKEAERQREEERLEIERRRAMPEEQRLKEDLERAQKLRDEKPKGNGAFLQKYWHKGAFHQDTDVLQNRDFTQALASHVDVSLLPKVMQVKDFGKRSRTKYTHLKAEDTTLQAPAKPAMSGMSDQPFGQDCFLCGGPHLKRDCPQNISNTSGGPKTGPNTSNLSSGRRWGDKSELDWRDRDSGHSPRPSRRSRSRDFDHDYRSSRLERDRGHRRSRSPPRRRSTSRHRAHQRHSYSRSRSPLNRDSHGSKRRRID